MKTTIDLADDVLKEAKVFCAQHSRTLRDLMNEALREKLNRAKSASEQQWESLFGRFGHGNAKTETGRIAKIIADEFSSIDEDEWV
ncbi:MAG: hypothetical protein KDK39_13920 [Leptospiraceae bacterium]|nr:hypothetical protein [Leptospiraceae bacterium]